MRLYILVGQSVVEEPDFLKWAEWSFRAGHKGRIVNEHNVGKYFISTLFLGLDHNFMRAYRMRIFETAVFWKDNAVEYYRCATWIEAEAQHEKVVCKFEARSKRPRLEVADAALD